MRVVIQKALLIVPVCLFVMSETAGAQRLDPALPCAGQPSTTQGRVSEPVNRSGLWRKLTKTTVTLPTIRGFHLVGGLLPTPNVAGQASDLDTTQTALAWRTATRPTSAPTFVKPAKRLAWSNSMGERQPGCDVGLTQGLLAEPKRTTRP